MLRAYSYTYCTVPVRTLAEVGPRCRCRDIAWGVQWSWRAGGCVSASVRADRVGGGSMLDLARYAYLSEGFYIYTRLGSSRFGNTYLKPFWANQSAPIDETH